MEFKIPIKTKNRIGVTSSTPRPTDPNDPNIGKKAVLGKGVFTGLEGILYPRQTEIKYDKLVDDSATGVRMGSEKTYLLLFFYKDTNELFCGIAVDPTEVTIEGGFSDVVPGEGTLADPHPCGYEISSGSGSQAKYYYLPYVKGNIRIDYDFYTAEDKIDVYYANDPDTLVATTGVRTGLGQLTFYYDPEFNGENLIVKVSDGILGTVWEYKVNCPK